MKKLFPSIGIAIVLSYIMFTIGYNVGVHEYKPSASFTVNNETIANNINTFRAQNGLPALKYNFTLQQSAAAKCQDMVDNDYIGHINPQTHMQGYEYIQQLIPNVPKGGEEYTSGPFSSDQQPVDELVASPDHKTGLLDSFTDVGVANCHRPSEAAGSVTIVVHLAQL